MLCLVKTRVSKCCERPVYIGARHSAGLICNSCHKPCKVKIRECWLDFSESYFVEVLQPDSVEDPEFRREDVTP